MSRARTYRDTASNRRRLTELVQSINLISDELQQMGLMMFANSGWVEIITIKDQKLVCPTDAKGDGGDNTHEPFNKS